MGERTGFEETIPASARVCAPCYKAHLLIMKEGPKSIDQDLIQLITDLKRGIPSSDTIKIKDDIVNKALHILAIYVGKKLLHEESLLLPAVHKTFSSIASDVACTTNVNMGENEILVTAQWLLSNLIVYLQHHLSYACRIKKHGTHNLHFLRVKDEQEWEWREHFHRLLVTSLYACQKFNENMLEHIQIH